MADCRKFFPTLPRIYISYFMFHFFLYIVLRRCFKQRIYRERSANRLRVLEKSQGQAAYGATCAQLAKGQKGGPVPDV